MTRRPALLRTCAGTAAGLLLLATAACGGDDEGSDDPAPTPTETTASTQDQATAAFEKYWDVYVQLSNSGDIDAAAFTGVAEGAFVEGVLKDLRDQADGGVVRVGEPSFSDFDTTVDGDTASSLVCSDESRWGATVDGEPIPDSTSDTPDPQPFVGTLELSDGDWIVTDVQRAESATCP